MDPIKGMNQIAQILRQKMAEGRPSHVRRGSGHDASKAAPAAGRTTKAGVGEIKRKIRERICALPEKERSGAKAAHIFVEMVIVWEFGDQLLNDPQFTELSNEVVKAMSASPAVWKKMVSMLNEFGANQ